MAFQTPASARADIPRRKAQLGGAIDPRYLDDLRAAVRQDDGWVQAFDVPQGLTVKAGERVMLHGSYRSTASPCSYIPALVGADVPVGQLIHSAVPVFRAVDALQGARCSVPREVGWLCECQCNSKPLASGFPDLDAKALEHANAHQWAPETLDGATVKTTVFFGMIGGGEVSK
jgi:hypothetical protein